MLKKDAKKKALPIGEGLPDLMIQDHQASC